MPDRYVEYLLKYGVDPAGLAAAIRSTTQLEGRFFALRDAATGFGNASKQNNLLAADAMARQSKAYDNVTKSIDLANKKALEYEATLRRAGGIPLPGAMGTNVAGLPVTGRGGSSLDLGFNSRNRLSRFGSELRMLPSTPLPGGLTSDAVANIIRITGALGEIAGAAGGLLPVLLPLAAAIVAIGGAFALLSRRNEELARATRALMNTQQQFYAVVAEGSQQDIQEALDNARRERDILQARIDENKRFLEALDQAGVRGIADVFNLGGAKELRESTQALEQQLYDAEFITRRYEAALTDGSAATRRFIADFEMLNPTAEDILKSRIENEIELQKELTAITEENAADQLESFEKRRVEILAELNVLQDREQEFWAIFNSDADEATRQMAANFIKRIGELETALEGVNLLIEAATSLMPTEAEINAFLMLQKGIGDIGRGIGDFIDRTDDITPHFEEVADAWNALNDATQEHADRMLAIEQRLQDAQIEAAYDRDRALEDAEYDASQRRIEAEQDASDARVKLVEDTERKRAEIERRFARSFLDAVGDRDALAAFQAEQRRDDELADLEASHEEQLAAIEDNYKDQLRTIDRSLQDQQRTIQRRYEDQLRTANLAHQRALQQESERWTRELQLRQQALQYAQDQLANALAIEAALQNQGYTAMIQNAASFANTLGNLLAGNPIDFQGEQRHIVIPDTIFADPGDFLQLAGGGHFGAYQPLIVGEHGAEAVMFDRPGTVANHQQTQQMMNGGNGSGLSITMDGQSVRATSRREAMAAIERFFDRVGVDD